MTIIEADKIFRNWSKWYWPCHFILHSIFLSKIPESFLPYPQDVLEKALNIIAKHYYDNGDLQTSRNIQESIAFLLSYTKDEDALQQASESFSNPKMREAMLTYIANYKKDWASWLEKQEK
jgi:hypothetical protein